MFGIKLSEAQRGFFDVPKVVSAMDKTTRRVFSKFGAFVRRRAQSSIRKRKKTSVPGEPPSGHTGLLRKFIFFSYDAGRKSVVIGPTLLGSGGGEAPRLLEHGGSATRKRGKQMKQVNYRPRPFMQPAYEAELPGLARLWSNSVR